MAVIGRYKNFDDCVKDQMDNNDRSQEEANNICGALEKRMNKAALVVVSEEVHRKYGLNRLSHQAAQRVMNAPNNNSSSNNQTLEQVGAEPDEEGTAEEEASDVAQMEMEGPSFDDSEDGLPGLDDNTHAQKHEGFDMAMFEAAIAKVEREEMPGPDELFIVDAALMKSAAKCTEGKYKGEICMGPPDGWPASENGKLSAKRVRAAITYGVQYGKIATLKKNGLCRYAKAVGVETKFCQGGTQESSLIVSDSRRAGGGGNIYSARLTAADAQDLQIKPFEQNNKLFIKAFLLDTGMNLNDWGVSPSTLDANISSYIGKPVCLQDDFDHPNSGDDNLQHQLSYQDNFRIGTIVDISKKGTRYDAIAEITDENAKNAFRSGSLPLYVSPQLYHTGAYKEGQENMTEWTGTHLAIVDKPAYGVKRANVGSQCTGESMICLAQLKKASLIKEHGYGNCGFCNYRLLMSKAM